MKISIIGTGGIGGYYGIILSKLGHDVHFLLHSDYEFVKSKGLLLQSKVHKDLSLSKVNAYKDSRDMPICDVVLVCLKTNMNNRILPEVIPHITDEKTVVILVQNGWGMEEDMADYCPDLQIAGATALIGCRKEKEGIIIHESYGNIDFGSYNVKDPSVLENLTADFNTFNIPSSVNHLQVLRWKKLVWNMAFNGLSVVLNASTDEIISSHLKRCKTIMLEVISSANAYGINIPGTFADEMIAFTSKMKSYYPSMKVDFDRFQSLELEYIYRKPIVAAREAGIEMLETSRLYWELQKISR